METEEVRAEEELHAELRMRYSRMSSVKDPKITVKENMGIIVLSVGLLCALLFIAIFALVSHYTSRDSHGGPMTQVGMSDHLNETSNFSNATISKEPSTYSSDVNISNEIYINSTDVNINKEIPTNSTDVNIRKETSTNSSHVDIRKETSTNSSTVNINKETSTYSSNVDSSKETLTNSSEIDITNGVSSNSSNDNIIKGTAKPIGNDANSSVVQTVNNELVYHKSVTDVFQSQTEDTLSDLDEASGDKVDENNETLALYNVSEPFNSSNDSSDKTTETINIVVENTEELTIRIDDVTEPINNIDDVITDLHDVTTARDYHNVVTPDEVTGKGHISVTTQSRDVTTTPDNSNVDLYDTMTTSDNSNVEQHDVTTTFDNSIIDDYDEPTTQVPDDLQSTDHYMDEDVYDFYGDLNLAWNSRYLPDSIAPVHYDLHLDIFVIFTSGWCVNSGLYTGSVTIRILVKSPTDFIVVHSNDFRLNVDRIKVTQNGKEIGEQIEDVAYNRFFEYYVIKLTDQIAEGSYDVTFVNFMGCINENSIGILLSSYRTNTGETK